MEKLAKLPRLYDRLEAIDVTVDLEHRDSPAVDLRVAVKQKEFLATSQSPELMAALDEAVEKIEQQLRKHKDKLQDRRRGPAQRE